MKHLIYILALAGTLAACSGDATQKDLMNYYNVELEKVTAMETSAHEAYGSVAGENYQNDSVMYTTLTTVVIPTYSEFYKTLESIKPETEEVQAIHKDYLEAAKDQLEAFKLIVAAIDKQDEELINTANGDFEKAKIAMDAWRDDFAESCKKHDVVVKEDSVGT
jgi:hypothetical protein